MKYLQESKNRLKLKYTRKRKKYCFFPNKENQRTILAINKADSGPMSVWMD